MTYYAYSLSKLSRTEYLFYSLKPLQNVAEPLGSKAVETTIRGHKHVCGVSSCISELQVIYDNQPATIGIRTKIAENWQRTRTGSYDLLSYLI